eukprot:6204036-Pleurochrysis_carterae.AAC.5
MSHDNVGCRDDRSLHTGQKFGVRVSSVWLCWVCARPSTKSENWRQASAERRATKFWQRGLLRQPRCRMQVVIPGPPPLTEMRQQSKAVVLFKHDSVCAAVHKLSIAAERSRPNSCTSSCANQL